MRILPFSLFSFFSILTLRSYAIDFLENDHLEQLYSLQDSSILEVKEGRHYLNSERISVCDNKLVLNSDYFGPLVLGCIVHDNEGIYLSLYDYYTCGGCERTYRSLPSECGTCGVTSFNRHEQVLGED